MSRVSRKFIYLVLSAAVSTLVFGAEPYPQRPIRIIVPAAPGGGVDTLTRILGPGLGEALGQQVVADNRPGAGTMLAADLVAKSPNDGHTLFMATSSFTINPALYRKIPYDPVLDFAPITLVATTPFVLVVHPSLPVRSVKELVTLAKSRPNQIYFASSGNGSSLHLAGELFKSMAHISLVHVPYKGGTPGVAALISGEVQVMFNNILSVVPHVNRGKLRILAVTSARRAETLPQLPTMAESGIKGYDFGIWWGIVAPKGISRNIVMHIHSNTAKVLSLPNVRKQLRALGVEPVGSTPEEFSKVITTDLERFSRIVKTAGMKVD